MSSNFNHLGTTMQKNLQNSNNLNINIKFFRDAKAIYGIENNSMHEKLYATTHSAGLDLRACFADKNQTHIEIKAGERAAIATGIAIEPNNDNVAAFVYSRSGLGAKEGLCVAQGVGVVDPDYRGEIFLYLLNTTQEHKKVSRGERVAQLIFQPFFRPSFNEAEELTPSDRNLGGFGHSGKF